MSKPLCIDLFAGLGGWTEGFLAHGYRVVGFDNERHIYGEHSYPAQLVLQDVLTLDDKQFKDATIIVASPPCQAYSYRAMPWQRAKALPPPDNSLFEACFRIQREACAAAGRHIPLVVENVRGAQKWVGRARWHFGSYYLWGDVPALMPSTMPRPKVGGFSWSDFGKPDYKPQAFNGTAERATKNEGGSWFAIGSPGQKVTGQNPDGRKLGTEAYLAGAIIPDGKTSWFFGNTKHELRATSSGSRSRKAASARIAKIPFALASWIAQVYLPLGDHISVR